MTTTPTVADFASLGLPESLLQTIKDVGYETPSPIQAQCIPLLLAGHDLLGQAQTGTGKTAAFALPLLARIDPNDKTTQLIVLAPTRELAIQVAEACQTYARNMPGFRVLPIYGGASYTTQLKQLKAHPQLVVGTPGRVMDHLRRGTLKLDNLKALVLDEADEMLRMGFIDDVEWILEHTPSTRQTALFSATMPKQIQKVAERYLRNPQTVQIIGKTQTAAAIKQRYWPVSGLHKLDALTRILEIEEVDGVIIFVRTKLATVELGEKLSARGFSAEALNGDMAQAQREKTIDKMRNGKLDILIATDVAARGLDIPRISHVINYDIPFDTESYVHRIGRTGRAGRLGQAILFVANRERRMLSAIERATRQPIELMQLPSEKDINAHRVERFKQQIDATLQEGGLDFFRQLLADFQKDKEVDPLDVAAALAKLVQGDVPLLLEERAKTPRDDTSRDRSSRERPARERSPRDREDRESRPRRERGERDAPRRDDSERPRKKREGLDSTVAKALRDNPEVAMQRFRLDVGYDDGVAPGHIVGAIANEADIESRYIGHIEIFDDHSLVDLPADMPNEVMQHLQKVWVCQRQLGLKPAGEATGSGGKKSFSKKPRSDERGSGDRGSRDFKRGDKKPEGRQFADRPTRDRSATDRPAKERDAKPAGFRGKSADARSGAAKDGFIKDRSVKDKDGKKSYPSKDRKASDKPFGERKAPAKPRKKIDGSSIGKKK